MALKQAFLHRSPLKQFQRLFSITSVNAKSKFLNQTKESQSNLFEAHSGKIQQNSGQATDLILKNLFGNLKLQCSEDGALQCQFKKRSHGRKDRKPSQIKRRNIGKSGDIIEPKSQPKIINLTVLDSATTETVKVIKFPPTLILPIRTIDSIDHMFLLEGEEGRRNSEGTGFCKKGKKFTFYPDIYPRHSELREDDYSCPPDKKRKLVEDCPPEKENKCPADDYSIINQLFSMQLAGDKGDCKQKKDCPKFPDTFDKSGQCEGPCRVREPGTKVCPTDLMKRRQRKRPPKPRKVGISYLPVIYPNTETVHDMTVRTP